MFLRLEIRGRYLEFGRMTPEQPNAPVPDNVPQPMVVYADPDPEPLGFYLPEEDSCPSTPANS